MKLLNLGSSNSVIARSLILVHSAGSDSTKEFRAKNFWGNESGLEPEGFGKSQEVQWIRISLTAFALNIGMTLEYAPEFYIQQNKVTKHVT